MKCIVISGIDGSGKTTVINFLISDLESKGYKVGYTWLRFNHYFAKLLHALARLTGLSVKVNNEMGTVWQHRFYKSKIFSSVYILATYLDSWIGKMKFNIANKKQPDFIICDRWIPDVLIDLGTKTHNMNVFEAKWSKLFFSIMPSEAFLFVIDRNNQDILDCRIENQVDPDFMIRNQLYKKLMTTNLVTAINNSGSIQNSVNQITNIIL